MIWDARKSNQLPIVYVQSSTQYHQPLMIRILIRLPDQIQVLLEVQQASQPDGGFP